MTDSQSSLYLKREYALYRYSKALEQADFDTIREVLQQAEHDAVLDEMLVAFTLSSGKQATTSVRPFSNGQSPTLNHSEEEKIVVTHPMLWQQIKPIGRRTSLVPLVLLLSLVVLMFSGILITNTSLRPLIALPMVQVTPTVQPHEVISAVNLNRLYNVTDIPKDGAALSFISFSPDSNYIAYENKDRQIQLWNVQTKTPDKSFTAPELSAQERMIVFSRDGKQLATNGTGVISVWNLENGTQHSIQTPLAYWRLGTFANRLVFSIDGRLIYQIMCGHSSKDEICDRIDVYGWDIVSGELRSTFQDASGTNPDAAFIATTQHWIAGYPDGRLVLRDVASNTTQNILAYGGAGIINVTGSPDGSLVATTDSAHQLQVYTTLTGSLKSSSSLQNEPYAIRLMTFAPNNDLLASIGKSGDTNVQFWNPKDGQKLRTLDVTDKNYVFSVSFSPDGTLMVTDSNDGMIRIWGIGVDSKL